MTSAAMKACKNAISSNSIPAFRRGTKISPPYITLGFNNGSSNSLAINWVSLEIVYF